MNRRRGFVSGAARSRIINRLSPERHFRSVGGGDRRPSPHTTFHIVPCTGNLDGLRQNLSDRSRYDTTDPPAPKSGGHPARSRGGQYVHNRFSAGFRPRYREYLRQTLPRLIPVNAGDHQYFSHFPRISACAGMRPMAPCFALFPGSGQPVTLTATIQGAIIHGSVCRSTFHTVAKLQVQLSACPACPACVGSPSANPGVCLRLPSDSSSRWTPLPSG